MAALAPALADDHFNADLVAKLATFCKDPITLEQSVFLQEALVHSYEIVRHVFNQICAVYDGQQTDMFYLPLKGRVDCYPDSIGMMSGIKDLCVPQCLIWYACYIANEIKREMKGKIDLKVGVHPIFGFKKQERWEVYREAAKKSDFLGGLPEKDEPPTDGRIGFKQHLKRILLLGQELKKPVHFHVDQANDPKETGTETLIEAVEWIGAPEIKGLNSPTVWAIHVISPSNYDQKRFNRLVDGLLKQNIGVICCPSASLSMRQLRPIKSPIHNSMARILEMLDAGVEVKIGTDNICDVFVPSSDGCMLTEIKILSNAIRFYIMNVLAKLATGKKLNEMDKEMIRRSLAADKEFFRMY